jgi:spermidine synthase
LSRVESRSFAVIGADSPRFGKSRERILLVNVLCVAVCALIYELLCGTLASYLLGDAVLQFSLVLGTYLFAMGAGAWVSRLFESRAAPRYVQAELLLSVVGGLSVPLLLLAVSAHIPLRPVLYSVVFLVGALVGLELPLLVAILRKPEGESAPFGDVVARALAYDYIGALGASVLFPLLLVPHLGLVKTSVLTGVLNALLALSATFVLRVERPALVRGAGACVLGVLALAFFRGEAWVAFATD